ncbi:NAD(P)H-quinone oxidoreductase subunit F [cyanobacterium endosymbiont of Epithemia turgida]|uniref:NAD(P)H-quinone oxidoreductase subunit F n=1 Tax=cyanobacterium endosymbiont of Epithemia turgida TaxID=718217 RepID=UPI0004D1BCCA|nr:NAD(P)H-quinone oxidoreductase subunit F [cyanobacterium endosymbiont of Epithemia turgida]BAP18342.1 NAD(P)H-quinone oxidoreductase subunit F [cyanobacterium endosymbiont of Epithemia turgida isolate EtSB Lake Yunoko]
MSSFIVHSSWLIPIYSLIGSVLTLPWSLGIIRHTGPRPAAYLSLLMISIAFIHSLLAFYVIWGHQPEQLIFQWLQVADLDLSLTIELSPISLGALGLVNGISLLAQFYALGYLEKDWSLARFFGLIGIFEAALGGIALSDSLLLSYGLLEILTLSTYLLVGFWYAQPLVATAARDAFLTKRVGDIILLMGLVTLSSYGEGLTFSELEKWAINSNLAPLTAALLGISLIAGPTGKCAQFPLNLWLDKAMEGPNPAGIMRNSVVVSAGAYVLIKLQPVFTLSPVSSAVLIILGSVTAVGTSLMALAQIDIKRTLSHSTSAYLGLVFIAVGLGQVDIALLLVFIHAITKALLFMSAGAVILTTYSQNITEMGGIWARMPATTISFMTGAAGLVALLPLGMFWTLQRWFNGDWNVPKWLCAIVLFVNLLCSWNLTRVFRLVFLGNPQPKTRRTPEVAWPIAFPMVMLTLTTLISSIVPIRWTFWLSAVPPFTDKDIIIVQWAIPLSIGSGIIGCLLGIVSPLRRSWTRPTQLYLRFFQDLFAHNFYLNRVYEVTVVAAVEKISYLTVWFDRHVVDGVVNLVGLATIFSGNILKYNVSGQSQFYILTILIGVSLLVCFFISEEWGMMINYWSSLIY